ncbi:MAG: aminotransferase class V-fold PLP-dependent enzyme [Chloroflexi bacterium]|nr:MAG: aminotransferase class V-fold PLP-dependent enzyme [Chloroflexota bacterium]
MKHLKDKAFSTRSVHAGERLNAEGINPVVAPIHPSVGYTFADSNDLDAVLGNEKPGFVYSTRYANPTVGALETAVSNLEGSEDALAFASGMAAIHIALLAAGVRASTSVVAAADIYGASYSLLQQIFTQLGANIHFVDVTNLDEVAQVVANTKPAALFVETISNPLMKVADLPQLAVIAHENDSLFLVDNTFCSPYLCNPIQFGADMVIHSATKFIGGHGDVMGGIVATSAALKERLLTVNKLIGSSIGPFEAWLVLRGLKTLSLRMKQHCQNALTIATWLQNHPKINHVNYAFLPDHPQYNLMQSLSNEKGGGGVLSFEIANADRKEVFAFMDALKLIQPATSLGDIYSLILYPAISSHRTLTPAERASLGIGDGLVRISVGIEDVTDIQADIAQALESV